MCSSRLVTFSQANFSKMTSNESIYIIHFSNWLLIAAITNNSSDIYFTPLIRRSVQQLQDWMHGSILIYSLYLIHADNYHITSTWAICDTYHSVGPHSPGPTWDRQRVVAMIKCFGVMATERPRDQEISARVLEPSWYYKQCLSRSLLSLAVL